MPLFEVGRRDLAEGDTDIRSEDEVLGKSADLNELLDRIGRLKQGVNIVILDACRINPFNAAQLIFRGAKPLRLAPVQAPPGILLAYSTSPGGVAFDNPSHTHSLYTRTLLTYLSSLGLPVEFLFKQVRIDVAREMEGRQVPWESSNMTVDYCFTPLLSGRCSR